MILRSQKQSLFQDRGSFGRAWILSKFVWQQSSLMLTRSDKIIIGLIGIWSKNEPLDFRFSNASVFKAKIIIFISSLVLWTKYRLFHCFPHLYSFQCKEKVPFRSSIQEVLCKKRFLRNFAKFTGKHLCLGLFFYKFADFSLQL